MIDANKFMNILHYDGTRHYSRVKGEVAYLDGSPLGRPVSMPVQQRIFAAVIVAAAVVIGLLIINNTVFAAMRSTTNMEEAVQANLKREASIESLPNVAALITMDDTGIREALVAGGLKVADLDQLRDNSTLSLVRAPSDMTAEAAASYYAKGINSLKADVASQLLNGSWTLSVNRVDSPSLVVRYVDFSTSEPAKAVEHAVTKEGFPMANVESGVDESKNTFTTGTLEQGGATYRWKVSALPLSEMYSVAGLPEDACYVGVRITKE